MYRVNECSLWDCYTQQKKEQVYYINVSIEVI
jgi:hypothetical protein